eukprot:391893-Pelagomonas_calceolata.AAC.4
MPLSVKGKENPHRQRKLSLTTKLNILAEESWPSTDRELGQMTFVQSKLSLGSKLHLLYDTSHELTLCLQSEDVCLV